MDSPWIRRTLFTRKCQRNLDYLEMNHLPHHRPGSEILPRTAAFSFQPAHIGGRRSLSDSELATCP
jgi:hypothetical protein